MAEYDEFPEDGGDDANDAQGRGNNERREKALIRKQMLDESSVAAFSQLGASFFAAARARLAEPRADELPEPTAEAIRARHERMVRNAKWRPSLHVEGEVVESSNVKGSVVKGPSESPQDDFANAARQRLLSKRKRDEEEKEEKPRNLRKTALSFAGSADDDF
eukprot:symbB.v1.2.002304.t1/scaffold107.1/size327550/20